MKTKIFLACAAIFLGTAKLSAVDHCVNENGNGGCFSTITAAINAAANGDRILITPKSGGAPYVENLAIVKSLQFLCAVDTQKYFVQGTITITPAIGRSITFVGLKQLGDFAPTGASPAGARCVINILGSEITGNVNFNYDNFNLTFASNILNGNVAMRYGKITGNLVNCTVGMYTTPYYSAIYAGNDATATNDTNFVVGNFINMPYTVPYYTHGVTFYSGSQYAYIANNYVNISGGYSAYCGGIEMTLYKSSAISRNIVMNNTVYSANAVYSGLMFATPPANAYTDVYNNLIIVSSASYGSIYNAAGLIGASFNIFSTAVHTSTFDNGTNLLDNNLVSYFDPGTGRPQAGSGAINAGSPDFSYYDLDLTVNDAGAYGGSFTLDNFFPIAGSTRVYMMYVPRRVNVSGTINIKADALDR